MKAYDFNVGDLVLITHLANDLRFTETNVISTSRISKRKANLKGIVVSKLVGVGSEICPDFLVICHCKGDDVAVYGPDELKKLY